MGKKKGEKKSGKTLGQTKDQTPLLSLSGTRKVVRTPTNPFETTGTVEVFVPKEIIARRIQDIFAGPNKGRKADHYLVAQASQICEGDKYPTIGSALTALSMCISSMRPTTDIILSSQASISDGLLEPCVRSARAAILRDLQQR